MLEANELKTWQLRLLSKLKKVLMRDMFSEAVQSGSY